MKKRMIQRVKERETKKICRKREYSEKYTEEKDNKIKEEKSKEIKKERMLRIEKRNK